MDYVLRRLQNGSRAGGSDILTSPTRDTIRYVLQIMYTDSNNVAEYEALRHGLSMAVSMCIHYKKGTSVTFWAERFFFCHTYDTSMTIIVRKPGIIIDLVGSYFYDKKS